MHAILTRNLVPAPPVSDLFGVAGRNWLSRQDLPADERNTVQALLRQLDFCSGELAVVSRELAVEALGDPVVARLMTIPGLDALTAISIVAAVGDFSKQARDQEWQAAQQAERACQIFVAHWQQKGPAAAHGPS